MPTKRRPTAEERDERVTLPLPAEDALAGLLAAGPHPDEDDENADE